MINFEYELTYHAQIASGAFRFQPVPSLCLKVFEAITYALCHRLLCPRLPRLGEAVRMKPGEVTEWRGDAAAWPERVVVAVGTQAGVPVSAHLDDGGVVVRGEYLFRWQFAPGSGPGKHYEVT